MKTVIVENNIESLPLTLTKKAIDFLIPQKGDKVGWERVGNDLPCISLVGTYYSNFHNKTFRMEGVEDVGIRSGHEPRLWLKYKKISVIDWESTSDCEELLLNTATGNVFKEVGMIPALGDLKESCKGLVETELSRLEKEVSATERWALVGPHSYRSYGTWQGYSLSRQIKKLVLKPTSEVEEV